MKKSAVGIMSLLILLFLSRAHAAQVGASISQVGEALHLEFKGLSQWEYNVDKKQMKNFTEFEIEVPRLSEPSVMSLKAYKGPGIESLSVQHDGPDGKDIITLKVSGANLEAFDYLTDQPSRLIIDIYQNTKTPAKKNAVEKTATAENKVAKITKTLALPKKGIAQRTPSSSDVLILADQGTLTGSMKASEERMVGAYDAADPNFERFKLNDYEIKPEARIASKENYYLDFPMLRIKIPEFEKLNINKPVYNIKAQDTEENKQARLLQTLFQNKRYNVFLKAVEWFFNKYPNSEYEEIVRFMWADVYYQQWLEEKNPVDFDLAMTRYRHAIEKFPKSSLVERTQMLMGFASLERGDYLATLKLFQGTIRNRPKSLNRDLAQLAVAESYLKLARFEEALQVYEDIEKDSFNKNTQIQAQYYKGDVLYQRGDYPKAIDMYKAAIQKYSTAAADFPNAYYNLASAYFKNEMPKESLNAYIEFVKLFPNHEYAAYAMTRAGEILDMMGADKTKVMGAFIEAQFRYGEEPAVAVARMRVLAAKAKTIKFKELDKIVNEVIEMAKKSPLPKADQFATLLITDSLASRGEYEKSIAMLVKFFQDNPTSPDKHLVATRINKNINLEIKNQVESGQFLEAMRTHARYADNWLKGSNRIDTSFYIGQAFEQAGVFKQAEKLYRDTLNKILAVQGTDVGKERNIFEKLPSADLLNLRLSNSEFQLGHITQAHEYMKSIKNPSSLSLNEQIERSQLAANLLEKKGDLPSAVRHLTDLIKTWKGIPELLAPSYLQLAEIEIKQGKKEDAIQSLQKIDQYMADSESKIPAALHAKSLELLGNLYVEKGDTTAAIKTYLKLIETYEATKPLSSIRYKVGQMYFKKGDLQKASDIWNGFKGEKSETWKRLAQEQLKNSEWNGEYKKYINRIPAMSERK